VIHGARPAPAAAVRQTGPWVRRLSFGLSGYLRHSASTRRDPHRETLTLCVAQRGWARQSGGPQRAFTYCGGLLAPLCRQRSDLRRTISLDCSA